MKKKLIMLLMIAILSVLALVSMLAMHPPAYALVQTLPPSLPVYAGDGITIDRGVDHTPSQERFRSGTIAAPAICNITGRLGFLTNEHVVETQSESTFSIYYRRDGSINLNQRIFLNAGCTDADPQLRGRNGGTIDAAFIPFDEERADAWNVTPHARMRNVNPFTNIRLVRTETYCQYINSMIPYDMIESAYNAAGDSIRRIGQTTGVTRSRILDTNAYTMGGEVADRHNLFSYARINNNSNSGDSGGPVYFVRESEIMPGVFAEVNYLIGIHVGHLQNWDRIGARIKNVISELNITPITNDVFEIAPAPNNPDAIKITGLAYLSHGERFNPRGRLYIPQYLFGRRVTHIGAYAFKNADRVTRISIPRSVAISNIGHNAFYGTTSLRFIYADERAPAGDLWDNNRLVHIPHRRMGVVSLLANATSIDRNAFVNRPYITGIEIHHTNPIFGTQHGILYYRATADIIHIPQGIPYPLLPDRITTITRYTFAQHPNLTSITLHQNITYIANNAFGDTYFQLRLPSGLSRIPNRFLYNRNPRSIYIPSSVTHIGEYAFAFNTRLRTINIPASVEHIGSRAFWHNSELRRVYLNRTHEQGITALGCNYVFFAASQLYWISVPIGSYYRYRLSASWAIHRDIISVFEPIRVDLIDGIGSNFWMTVNRRLGVGLNLANMIPPGRPGHTFAGWRATDGTRIYNNKIISRASHGRLICNNHPFPSKMTYRIVLEARWSAIKSFNTQTAEVIEPMAVYIGDRVGDLPAPARAGFAFGGWWTETGGQGAKITSTSIAHSNQTLFAHWFVPGQYRHMNTISFSGQGQIEVSGIFEGRAMYIRFETLQRTTFSAHIDEHGNFWAVALEHIPNLKIEIMGSVQDGVIRLNVAGGFGTRITARIYFV